MNLLRVGRLQEDLLFQDLDKHDIPDKTGLANILVEDETRFQDWHISTPSGTASKDLKKLLTLIWNTDRGRIYELLKHIENRFHIKFAGQQFWLYEHKIIFLDTKSQQPLILKASKLRGGSLQSITAAKISSQLERIDDIQSMVKQGLIPSHLENLLIKYL